LFSFYCSAYSVTSYDTSGTMQRGDDQWWLQLGAILCNSVNSYQEIQNKE
jgi:hypothetical protein